MSMLIAIAVIGFLAAIAIPAYQDYTLRAESAGAFALAEEVEAAAHDYVVEHGAYPESLEEIGIAETYDSGPVAAIQVIEEGFELSLTSPSAQLDGATIVVSALAFPDGSIGWDCSGGTLAAKYRPPQCRQAP